MTPLAHALADALAARLANSDLAIAYDFDGIDFRACGLVILVREIGTAGASARPMMPAGLLFPPGSGSPVEISEHE